MPEIRIKPWLRTRKVMMVIPPVPPTTGTTYTTTTKTGNNKSGNNKYKGKGHHDKYLQYQISDPLPISTGSSTLSLELRLQAPQV